MKLNWIIKNLVLGCLFVAAFLVAADLCLKAATRHNREIVVPDFAGMTYREAAAVAERAGVRVVESDSVYIPKLRKGAVYNQTPPAGSRVKEGRRIMLTTNSRVPKKIPMPSLIGLSMRQARAELEARALVPGRLIYVEDIATNLVLKQQIRGRDIPAGKMIRSGTTVNLVVGVNASDPDTYIPSLNGKNYSQAFKTLQENSLNVGKVTFDRSVRTYKDTVNAVVFRQDPQALPEPCPKGTAVAISLTVNPEKVR